MQTPDRAPFPKTLQGDVAPFMSVIPYRKPVRKVHRSLGLARTAVGQHFRGWPPEARCDMAIYELKNGEWHLLHEIKKGDKSAPWH